MKATAFGYSMQPETENQKNTQRAAAATAPAVVVADVDGRQLTSYNTKLQHLAPRQHHK